MTPIVAFFNNKGGVGKTSLVYHLTWMYRELGRSVLAVDLDPQANLTAAFVDEERLEVLWPDGPHPRTISGAIDPLIRGIGDIVLPPATEAIGSSIHLLAGDLALARIEDELSEQWPHCLDGKERAFRVVTAFWRLIRVAADECGADVVLVDVGPNLGAINRSALVAADHVVVPLAPDLFSLQGLRNLGPTLQEWRAQWSDRRDRRPPGYDLPLPGGAMAPLGYVILQHSVRLNRPVRAFDLWMRRIPGAFRSSILDDPSIASEPTTAGDPWALGTIKHYQSLVPMAQEARKPVFLLRSADGAIGAHQRAVQNAYGDFKTLAESIDRRLRDAERQSSSVDY